MHNKYLFDLKHFFKCLSKSNTNRFFIIQQKSVHKQSGSSDCGLFSLAYAASICNRKDPSQKNDQTNIRSHYNSSIINGELLEFPSNKRNVRGKEQVSFLIVNLVILNDL